ncbi:MAG: ACT domain-containing protein [Phycisphaerales bacterium]|nr:MAG: ACT domain-containing protein [Phycisphaerales bacterium]
MPYQIMREEVWVGEIEDRPGGLADKLEPLLEAEASLDFMIARRAHDKPGITKLFVAPLLGEGAARAAEKLGLSKWTTAASVCVEGLNRPGLAAAIARTLGNAGINMRGVSGARLGDRAQVHIAFDNAADADKAINILNKALNG